MSVSRLDGSEGDELVEMLLGADETQAVLEEIRGQGFTAKPDQAVAKRMEAEFEDEPLEGIVVPLESQRGAVEGRWGTTAELVNETIGYLTVDTGAESTPTAFLMGVAGSETTAANTLRTQSEQTLSLPSASDQRGAAINAMEIVTPHDTHKGSVSRPARPAAESDSSTVQAMSEHTVRECFLDNQGLIGTGATVATCAACFAPDPADATLVGLIIECLSCIGTAASAACLVGYCQDEDGGSLGDKFCRAANFVATNPVWLLPGIGSGLKATGVAVNYGCNSNESTDCITPLVD